VITSRIIKWAGNVARMGEMAYIVLVGNLRERDHLEDADLDESVI